MISPGSRFESFADISQAKLGSLAMMVNLASVDEETENETPAEAPKETLAHDEKEEKVRVDRRKLEQMLQANGDGDRTIAEEFFSKVMLDTSTRISWPSKLKIGAKSKKDPHIKIAGLPESVKKAKEMVVAKLESKANRVTLKMDVSHTDHSHIIGRRGQSIKKVMEETGCHIHFPDSNRGPTNTEKSNQVSIAGQPEGVEKARTRIRELLPLVLMFEVPLNNAFLPLDPLAPSILTIAQRYDVTFAPRGTSPVGYLVVAIRGSQDNISNIQEAMGCLCKHLTGRFQIPNIVSLQFDIAPQHHMFVVGRAGCNIKEITDATGAKFEFPDPSVVSRKGNVTITGSVNAVIQARAMLVKLLPLLLMFDLKEEEARSLEDKPDKLKKLMDKFNVTIMVKPKPKQPSKSVVIKSKEFNSQNMYLTRLEVLGTPMDPYATRHPSFDSFHRHVHAQTNFPPTSIQAWYPGIGQSPYSSPTASPTPCLSDSAGRMRSTPSPTRLPPGFEPTFKHGRSESFTNGDTRERSQTGESQRARSQGTPASDGGSPKQFSEYCFPRRNSEPTPIGESWSSDQAILDLKKSNGSISSLVPSEQKPKFALYEGAKNADKRLSHPLLDSHGSNLASSGNSLTSSLSYNFDHFLTLTPPQQKFIDYEEQISKANKLMTTRKVIHPQVRTPTDQWSGLHLSKSTPDGALRKPIGKSQLDSRLGIPSTDELPEPDSTPSVRQDFSASFQNPSNFFRRGVRSPFSEQNFLQSLDCELDTTAFHEVLKAYGVENFAEVFERQEIDFATFLTLTKEDLKEAGIEPLGARKKMEHAIEQMKKLKDKAIREQYQNKAQSFHVTNPMDFNSQSGRW